LVSTRDASPLWAQISNFQFLIFKQISMT